MSMYYAGYEVFGMLLKEEDISFFKDRYIALNPTEFAKCEDDEEKMDFIDERLICSDGLIGSPSTGNIDVVNIDGTWNGNCEGAVFYPMFNAEKGIAERYNSKDFRGENTYIIVASIQCDPISVFRNRFYKDPEEVVAEMKNKVGNYLPKNFPYHERIGTVDYACYA